MAFFLRSGRASNTHGSRGHGTLTHRLSVIMKNREANSPSGAGGADLRRRPLPATHDGQPMTTDDIREAYLDFFVSPRAASASRATCWSPTTRLCCSPRPG